MTRGLQLFVSLKDLQGDPIPFDLVATPDRMAELQQRFGLVGLDGFRAAGLITPLNAGAGARLEGRIQAKVTQNCVVTLEPVVQAVDENFVLEFGDGAEFTDDATGELVVLAEQDQTEPMPEDGLDVAALVTEQLALAIDPYPRKEGADLGAVLRRSGIDPEAGRANPFAALAALKTKT